MWLHRHWPLVVGAAPWIVQIWHWFKWALEWGEHTDYITHHFDDLRRLWGAIPEAPGWLNILLLIGGMVLIWWDLVRRQRPSGAPALATPVPLATSEPTPSRIDTKPPTYIAEAYVYSGSLEQKLKPRYWMKLARNAKNVRVFIDHSHWVGGLMGFAGWSQRTRILIAEIKDLAREQVEQIDILTTYERDGQIVWRWGNERSEPTNNQYLFLKTFYRGRVVFMVEDGTEEYCYFLVEECKEAAIPKVIGEHMWSFKQEWEAEQ
jgi:hypothetical protein